MTLEYVDGQLVDVLPFEDTAARSGAPKAAAEKGDFRRGLESNIPQAKELFGGTVAFFGDMAERAGLHDIGGSLKDWGLKVYEENATKDAALAKPSDSFTNVLNGSASAIDFLQHALGYVTGQAAETGAAALAGGLLGTAAGPEGTLAGAAAGVVERKGIEAMVAKFADAQIAKRAAAQIVAANAAKKPITREIALEAAKNSFKRDLGQTIGLVTFNLEQELGQIYPEAVQQAKDSGTQLSGSDLFRIAASATGAAAIESWADKIGLRKVLGGGEGATALRRAAYEVPAGMVREAGTEGVQTVIERAGAGQPLTNEAAKADIINSMAVGAVGGTTAGTLSVRQQADHADVEQGMTPEQRIKTGVGSARFNQQLDELLSKGVLAVEEQQRQLQNFLSGIHEAGLLAANKPADFLPEFKPQEQAAPLESLVPETPPASIDDLLKDAESKVSAATPVSAESGVRLPAAPLALPAPAPRAEAPAGVVVPAGQAAAEEQRKADLGLTPDIVRAQQQQTPVVKGLATAVPAVEGAQAPPAAGPTVLPTTPLQPSVSRGTEGTTMSAQEINREAQDAGAKPDENGHVMVQGMPITIETAAGQPRKPGWQPLAHHYGSIKRTKGADGESVDVFLGPNPDAKTVYVVDQVKKDGTFDEHKAMVGFRNEQEARDAYAANYPAGWKGMGAITPMPVPQFKAWVDGGSKLPVNRNVLRTGVIAPQTGAAVRAPEGPAVEAIHAAADAKGVIWDNNPEFMALTKRITGKEHLDDLNPEQRRMMLAHLNSLPAASTTGARTQLGVTVAHGAPVEKAPAAPSGEAAAVTTPKPADLGTAFRRFTGERRANPVGSVQNFVSAVTGGWSVKPHAVKAIATFADAPAAVQQEFQRQQDRGAKGAPPAAFLHQNEQGQYEAYVVSDQLPADHRRAAVQIMRDLYHEGVAHHGLRQMFGERMNKILGEAGRLYGDRLQAKAEEYGFDLNDPHERARATDELIASMMEDPNNHQLPMLRRIMAAIREHLRPIFKALGHDLTLTDDELIRDFIMPVREYVLNGRGGTMAERKRVLGKYGSGEATAQTDTAFKRRATRDQQQQEHDNYMKLAQRARADAKRERDPAYAAKSHSYADMYERAARNALGERASFSRRETQDVLAPHEEPPLAPTETESQTGGANERPQDSLTPREKVALESIPRAASRRAAAVARFRSQLRSDTESRGLEPRPFIGKSAGDGRPVRVLGAKVKQTFTLHQQYSGPFEDAGIANKPLHELQPGDEGAQAFHQAISDAKTANKYGASVYVYEPGDYAGMRLFVTDDGQAGFALKDSPVGKDIVSVFNTGHDGTANLMMPLAVQEGGRRLDAFDTVLPQLYAQHGFKVVARQRWNEEYAPPGWDKELFREFNKGEPDVVYMVHDYRVLHAPDKFVQHYEGDPVQKQNNAIDMGETAFRRGENQGLSVESQGAKGLARNEGKKWGLLDEAARNKYRQQARKLLQDERRQPGAKPATAAKTSEERRMIALGISEKITDEMNQNGFLDMVGRTIEGNTPEERNAHLATLAQILRNPRYETFRWFFTNGNTIVHVSAVTSRLPAEVNTPWPGSLQGPAGVQWAKDQMDAAGADGYYIMHNHPSGDATASGGDKAATQKINRLLPGFLGHVILDSNQYGTVDASGVADVVEMNFGEDQLLKTSIPHRLVGEVVLSVGGVSKLGLSLKKPGWVTLFGLSRNNIRAVMEVPESQFTDSVKQREALKEFQDRSGAQAVIAHGTTRAMKMAGADHLIREGWLFDGISAESGTSYQELGVVPGVSGGFEFGPDHGLRQVERKFQGKIIENAAIQVADQQTAFRRKEKLTTSAKAYTLDRDEREKNFRKWFGKSVMVEPGNKPAPGESATFGENPDPNEYSDQIMEALRIPDSSREEYWNNLTDGEKDQALEDYANVIEAIQSGKPGPGDPQIWYHGTARDVKAFRAKQAGAIFVTRGHPFAEAFAGMSQGWSMTNFHEVLTPKQIAEKKAAAIEALETDAMRSRKRAAESPGMAALNSVKAIADQLGYEASYFDNQWTFTAKNDSEGIEMSLTDLPLGDGEEIQQAIDEARGLSQNFIKREREKIMSDEPSDNLGSKYFVSQIKEANTGLPILPEGPNIIPVYVKAENPFDYEDFRQTQALRDWLTEAGVGQSEMSQIMSDVENGRWQTIESPRVQTALKDLGHDGFYVTEMGEKNLAVYQSTQLKSVYGNNGFFDNENPDIAFRRPGNRLSWDAPENTWWDNLTYLWQDKQIDTKRVIDIIRKTGGTVSDAENVHELETLYHGRSAARTEDFWKNEFVPLLEDMTARSVTMPDLEKYLLARQAEETNKVIARRNPNKPDLQDGGSGMKTADARTFLHGLSAIQRRNFTELAAKVDKIIEGTRNELVSYGLETQATIDGWKRTFPNYIPLHREDVGDHMKIGQGFSVRGSATKARTGSQKSVVNILGNIAQQRDAQIIRGEKNIVANGLIELARNNPNPDFWEVDDPPMLPYIDAAGIAREMVDPNYKGRDNVITSRTVENGAVKEHSVRFVYSKETDRAYRMAKALKNLDAPDMGEFMGATAKMTRYFASINTQFNPVFGVVNLVRDFQGALFNLSSTPLRGQQAKLAKLVPSALRGIYADLRAIRRGQHPTSQWALEWEEFQREGGQTGYRDLFKTGEDRANKIKSELERLGRSGTSAGLLEKIVAPDGVIGGWLTDYNTTMENAMRLAAYKAAKEHGMSKQAAANLAKNLTVNFNRKGQMSRQVGTLYAFFNASVQGTARLAETLFEYKGEPGLKSLRLSATGAKIVAGGILLGVMQELALQAAGFDDDEPPEFLRQRNIIIPIGDKKYISIPMPLGMHVIPNLGRVGINSVMGGFKDMSSKVSNLIGLIADAFNPVGSAGLSLQTLSPTVADPLVALAENKDWTGKPIAKPDLNPLKPEAAHLRVKDTATWYGKLISEGLDYLGGGTEFTSGAISITPDQIDFLIGQFTGGVGRELGKAAQLAQSAATGEELPTYKIPLLGRLYGSAEGQAPQASSFYKNIEMLNRHQLEIKGRQMSGVSPMDYINENPEARLVHMGMATERRVAMFRRRKRDLIEKGADPERIRTIDSLITDQMKMLNDRVKAARGETVQ